MARYEAQKAVRASTAVGAILASGAMLFVGPMSIAVADPDVEVIPLPTVENLPLPAPDLAETSQTESMRMQTLMDRNAKLEAMVSNLLKTQSDTSSAIACNLR